MSASDADHSQIFQLPNGVQDHLDQELALRFGVFAPRHKLISFMFIHKFIDFQLIFIGWASLQLEFLQDRHMLTVMLHVRRQDPRDHPLANQVVVQLVQVLEAQKQLHFTLKRAWKKLQSSELSANSKVLDIDSSMSNFDVREAWHSDGSPGANCRCSGASDMNNRR